MKTFKNFLNEAKQIKVGDKVKSKNSFASTNNVKGEVVDIETVRFASGDQIRYKVKEPDGSITDLRADDIVKESLTEAKYEVEVEVRDAKKANEIAKDMFRGSYTQDGSNSFVFKKENDYEDFKSELESQGVNLLESQINEAVSADREFMKISSMIGDVKNSFRDVARQIRKETDMPQRDYERLTDSVEDAIVQLRKEMDNAQTKLKKW